MKLGPVVGSEDLGEDVELALSAIMPGFFERNVKTILFTTCVPEESLRGKYCSFKLSTKGVPAASAANSHH